MTDKERIIEFIQRIVPEDFECGRIELIFPDDGTLLFTVKPKLYTFERPYCQNCKKPIYEMCGKCPDCGQAITWQEDV